MPASLHSDGKRPRRVPEERAGFDRDFRLQFGRRMTKLEEGYLHLGNAALDFPQHQYPQKCVSACLVERARQTCEHSRDLISRAARTLDDSKALLANCCRTSGSIPRA